MSAIDRVTTRPVILRRQGAMVTDVYGVEQPSEWTTEPATVYLQQTVATEVTVGAEVYQSDWLMVARPGLELNPWDQVQVPDMDATFEVVGWPARLRRPRTDEEHHVEVRLRLVNT